MQERRNSIANVFFAQTHRFQISWDIPYRILENVNTKVVHSSIITVTPYGFPIV